MTSFWKGVLLVTVSPIVGVLLGWVCTLLLVALDRLLPDVLPGISKTTPQEAREALTQIGALVVLITMIAVAVRGVFMMFE